MTSKEAIENIKRTMIIRRHGIIDVGNKYNREILTIEKDLEVLKIVKEHKLLNYVLKNKKCADMYKLTDEEIYVLKEWLENEIR